MKARIALAVFLFAAAARAGDDACPDRDPLRRPYFGDTHVHGAEGVRFYTRAKAVTARWPRQSGIDLGFPTNG